MSKQKSTHLGIAIFGAVVLIVGALAVDTFTGTTKINPILTPETEIETAQPSPIVEPTVEPTETPAPKPVESTTEEIVTNETEVLTEPVIDSFALSWKNVEPTLKEKGVEGDTTTLYRYGFSAFIPSTFSKNQTSSVNLDDNLLDETTLIASYSDKDTKCNYIISYGDFPYEIDDIEDIAHKLNEKHTGFYDAEINGIKFLDIEYYDKNRITLITKASNFTHTAGLKDFYYFFTITQAEDESLINTVMALMGSIQPITSPQGFFSEQND